MSDADPGRVRGDPYCVCGRNLHGTPIEFDDRTGLPLARCPDCGRYHASGAADDAATQWAARFWTALVLAWAATLLGLAGVAAMIQAFLNVIAYDEVLRPDLLVETTGGYVPREEDVVVIALTLLAPLVLGGAAGLFQSIVMWHVRGLTRWLPMIGVLGLAVLACLPGLYEHRVYGRLGMHHIAVVIIGGTTLIAAIGWAAMLFLGRPIARGLARVILPPTARRHAAFLWTADGREVPA